MTLLFASAALGGYVVDLPADVSRSKQGVASQTATVNFNRDGTITNDVGGSLGDWVRPKHSAVGDGYEVKYDFVSGDALSAADSTSGAYIAITSTRAYSNTQPVDGTRSTVLTWSVRAAGGSSALDTATGTITAINDV